MKFIWLKFLFLFISCLTCKQGWANTLKFSLVGVPAKTQGWQVSQMLADEISKRSGVEIILIPFPGKRATISLQSGIIDGDFSRVAGFEKEVPGLIRIQEPINSHPYLAYTTNKKIKINGWKSLKPYRVCHLSGWKVIELNLKPYHKNLIALNSAKQCLKFVGINRADLFISIPFITEPILREDDTKHTGFIALKPPLDFLHVYIYLLPKHAAVANKIEKSLESLKKDGTHKKILDQL